jgi:SAM-dependent methyltransferase
VWEYDALSQFEEAIRVQQRLYAESGEVVRGKGFTEADADGHYRKYVGFVDLCCSPGGRLLDVGCGNGWSSYCLAKSGYEVTGVDLNPGQFEPPSLPSLRLQEGSAMDLPFPDASFDAVGCYQTLEHVPDPGAALREMFRVVGRGGVVVVVSPNLLSVLTPLRGMAFYVWRNRPVRTILFRAPGMPRHPAGNTLPELAGSLFRNGFALAGKLIARGPRFSMREPDLTPPFHSDNDACYLCNPVDLVKFVRSDGGRVLRNGWPGRPPLSWLVATGTFVAARKG